MRLETAPDDSPDTAVRQAEGLAPAARRRGLQVILAGTFLMYFGFFVCIPLIAVRFVDGLGWSAASVGFVLGARQITQFGLTFVGGALADRFGPKVLLCLGMLVRGLGFASMGLADSFGVLLVTTVLASLGGAMFESPRLATIAALTDDRSRARFLSLASSVGGVGMTLGPLVGAALYRLDFALVCAVAGACYVIGAAFTWPLLPEVRSGRTERLTEGLELAWRDRRFMAFVLVLTGLWFGSVQFSISWPLEAVRLSGVQATVGWVYTLNAVLVVGLQYPLMQWLERRLEPLRVLVLGVVGMALGFFSVAVAGVVGGLVAFFAAVAMFSLGQLIALPGQQAMGARLADRRALGSYFGVQSLAQAVGGSIGSVAGGALYGLGREASLPMLPWLAFTVITVLTVWGLSRLRVGSPRV